MYNIELLAVFSAISVSLVSCCGFPGSPAHANLTTSDERFMEGTEVTFVCDPGYILLGRSQIRCVNSEWDVHGLPYCVREIAFSKPSGMSSRNQTSSLAVDYQVATCADTALERKHEWWIDLIETTSVDIVEVHYGVDLNNLTVDIDVEDPESNFTSRCVHSESTSVGIRQAKYFICNQTTFGRKLTISISAQKDFILKLCEVKVYSQDVLSPQDACGTANKGKIESLKGQCYEVTPVESSFDETEAFCASQGGSLWNGNQSEFVSWMMNVHNLDSVWYQSRTLDANSETNTTNCTAFTRGDQIGDRNQQNTTCSETRFGICVRPSQSCGKPRLPKHLASWSTVEKVPTGESLGNFSCENGFHLSGPLSYQCLKDGQFRKQMPTTCRQSMCGEPPSVPNAFPVLTNEPRYYCANDSFVLNGDPNLKCDPLNSRWETPHVVCLRLSTGTKYIDKTLRERLLQGADLFPVATKVGLVMFIVTLIVLKVLMVMAVVNLVRYYRVVKPKLTRNHNSSVLLTSMHAELARVTPRQQVTNDANNNNLIANGELELSSGDAQVVIRTTGSSTPKAPETPKMRLNESSIRESKTD